MTLAGALTITVECDEATVRRVGIASTRPFDLPRILAGRSIAEGAALVPALFAVCRHAQSAASAEALGAALGEPPSFRAWRGIAVAVESLQEDLWRLLVDWPMHAGAAPDITALAEARRAAAPLLELIVAITERNEAAGDAIPGVRDIAVAKLHAIAADRVFGEPAATFLDRLDARSFRTWAARTCTPAALVARILFERHNGAGASGVLPLALDRGMLERSVIPELQRDRTFTCAPTIDGQPRITGAMECTKAHGGLAALLREEGDSLGFRCIARLVQLAMTLDALGTPSRVQAIDAWSPRDGEGVAVVRTARGSLVHWAKLAGSRIAAYAIVAPTDWTFHPEGAVAAALRRLHARDRDALRHDAEWIATLADACVPCAVELADA